MSLTEPSRQWMQALARLRGQVVRMRTNKSLAPAEALNAAELALGLVEDVRQECAGLQQRVGELERALRAHTEETRTLLDLAPLPLITTDASGIIIESNRAGALFLGRSAPRLRDELLLHFFDDRAAFTEVIRSLGDVVAPRHVVLRLRPRERAPFDAEITIARDPRAGDSQRWLWFLTRISELHSAARSYASPSSRSTSSHSAEN